MISFMLTHRSCAPAVVLTEPPSLPATVLSRSDCDWTGVSLSLPEVIASAGCCPAFQTKTFPLAPAGVLAHRIHARTGQ